MNDDMNPTAMFQTWATALLLQVAKGEIDAQEFARRELANRGVGGNGEWVGFAEAAKRWEVSNNG